MKLLLTRWILNSFFFSSSDKREKLHKDLHHINQALNRISEKIEVEGKARSDFYTALQEILAKSAKARDLTNTLLLKLVNDKDHHSVPSESQRSPVAPPLPSRPALLSGGLFSLGIILFLGGFYALSMFLFYEFLHLAAWLLSVVQEPGAVLSPTVQPLPTLPPESVPTEVGATGKLEPKPESITQNHSFWYWTAIVSIGSIVAFSIYRAMVKDPKNPGTSDKEVEASDRSRSLEIIQNLPDVPHRTVHQVTQTMESPSRHRADSSCQTDSSSSLEPPGVSTQTGPPVDPVPSDIDLNTRFEKLQHEFLEDKSRHTYEQAKSFSEMTQYKIEAEQASSFIKDFHLTKYFDRWKNDIMEGFTSMRDRYRPTRPESSGARDRGQESRPPESSGARDRKQDSRPPEFSGEQSKPPNSSEPTSSEGEE